MNKFPKIAALFLLLVSVAVAQEARPDEQTRVYQDNGKWSRQITGILAAAKNLRVKVDSGVVKVVGGTQQTIHYVINNRSYASSEEKARREFESYKINAYCPWRHGLGGGRMGRQQATPVLQRICDQCSAQYRSGES